MSTRGMLLKLLKQGPPHLHQAAGEACYWNSQVLSIFFPSKSTWRMLCESAIYYRPSITTIINLWWTSDLISTMNNGYVLPALPSSQLSLPSLCICPPLLLSWYVHKSKLSDACGQSLAGSCKKKQVRKLVTSTYISLSYFHCGAVAGCHRLGQSDKDLHRFVWRTSLHDRVKDFCMTKHQAELMHLIQFPLAAKAVDDAAYVDDGVTGADSLVSSCRLFSRKP